MNWGNSLKKALAPLQRKIYLMMGRAILTAVDNSTTTQLVQLTLLSGETISDVERFQEYGFETYPFKGAEGLAAFMNGNRDRGVVLCIMDRQYRPDDLSEGEVATYTDEDKLADGHRIWFKRGQIVQVDCKEAIVNASVKAEVNTKDATINCSAKCAVNATSGIDLDGGTGAPGGVVNSQSACPLIGGPHIDFSANVKVSK